MESTFKKNYATVLGKMPLTEFQKVIIKSRYMNIIASYEWNYLMIKCSYILCTMLTIVGGALVTAFVSFDRAVTTSNNVTFSVPTIDQEVSTAFLWIVWALGIIISVSGSLLHVFSLPKKYVLGWTVLEKLYSEGWLYVSGAGNYAKVIGNDARFVLFMNRVEKIKLKAVESAPEVAGNETADILSTGYDDASGTAGRNMTTSRRSNPMAISKVVLPSVGLPTTLAPTVVEDIKNSGVSDNILTDEENEGGFNIDSNNGKNVQSSVNLVVDKDSTIIDM